MNKYKPIIGLEIHTELKTNSKMFCACKNDPFGADQPNIYTCPVCLGMPGALPIPNKKAIEWTIKLGLAVGCQINLFSKFDRKHYFYPDLAKGYQISQYDLPFCYQGQLNTSQGVVGINRIHLEEDTGKLLHETVDGKEVSLIDFNRSGVPLVEIVTEPDITSAEQAHEYAKNLREIVRYLEIGDCKMAEGEMRLEANISLAKPGSDQLPNYKVEVKNINSFRFLEQAIKYEIDRQTKILDVGKVPVQETRGWDAENSRTFSQRTKEEAADYRYFPDPDIPPIELTSQQVELIRTSIPELPAEIRARWLQEFNLSENNAQQLATNQEAVSFIENLFKAAKNQKIQPNDLANDLVNKKITIEWEGSAASEQQKRIVESILNAYQKLHQTTEIDQDDLDKVIKQVFDENPDAVDKFKSGKTQIVGFLMGQVMQQLSEKPDPSQLRQRIQDLLA